MEKYKRVYENIYIQLRNTKSSLKKQSIIPSQKPSCVFQEGGFIENLVLTMLCMFLV